MGSQRDSLGGYWDRVLVDGSLRSMASASRLRFPVRDAIGEKRVSVSYSGGSVGSRA
jgi:hypothetical protein